MVGALWGGCSPGMTIWRVGLVVKVFIVKIGWFRGVNRPKRGGFWSFWGGFRASGGVSELWKGVLGNLSGWRGSFGLVLRAYKC